MRDVQWFLQVTLAVRYMHSCKVLHRDLKTENVFLNKSAALCKLGMSVLPRISWDSILFPLFLTAFNSFTLSLISYNDVFFFISVTSL